MILNINQMLPAEMYLYLFIRPRRDLQHRGYLVMDTCPMASINPAHVSPVWRTCPGQEMDPMKWTNRPAPALKLLNQPFSGNASQSQQSVIFSHSLNGAKLEYSLLPH